MASDSIPNPGPDDGAGKMSRCINGHISAICNDNHNVYGAEIVTRATAQQLTCHIADVIMQDIRPCP